MSTFQLNGKGASPGIAIAKAYLLEKPTLLSEKKHIQNSELELIRFQNVLLKSKMELKDICNQAHASHEEVKAAIFDAHYLILEDPEFITPIQNKIIEEHVNAEFAIQETVNKYVSMLEQSENLYIRERAIDVFDIQNRLISHLLEVQIPNPSLITEDIIVIAKELTPSDTSQFNPNYVKGIATERGSIFSHSSIIARSLEIPAVVEAKMAFETISHGDVLIVDGFRGQVHINPSDELVKRYYDEYRNQQVKKKQWAMLREESTITKDGHPVALLANIGSEQELESVLTNGAEGVGLFRTEFLFMKRDQVPSEEEQFQAYQTVISGMKEKPVIIRTLDIGGDKVIPSFMLEDETNPFLGVRSIRYSLMEITHFKTQMRALLRASVYGNLKIMFPMISTLEEFRQAKKIFLEVKQELTDANIAVNEEIELGIMVEVPATAIMADAFAKEVDFFSIGTNDLVQYMMAADRMNDRVAHLYQPLNPAILRLIKMVVDSAHSSGKWVGICGEMAGDKLAIPVLLGLGLDEISMNPKSILPTRSYIQRLERELLIELSQRVLRLQTENEVKELVQDTIDYLTNEQST